MIEIIEIVRRQQQQCIDGSNLGGGGLLVGRGVLQSGHSQVVHHVRVQGQELPGGIVMITISMMMVMMMMMIMISMMMVMIMISMMMVIMISMMMVMMMDGWR